MRFTCSPASIGDVGYYNGRGSEYDSEARRRQRARVLFQTATPGACGIEATGSMQWFLNLMEELGMECQVGHLAQIRAAEPRKQKHDRRDAELILRLLAEGRFPAIWLPSKELLDLRALLQHRHQWVRIRTRIQNALQAIALANGLRRGPALWSQDGQSKLAALPLAPHTAYRRNERGPVRSQVIGQIVAMVAHVRCHTMIILVGLLVPQRLRNQ